MKTVHVVEFGCKLISEPLEDQLAEDLLKRLQAKDLIVSTRKIPEGNEEKPDNG